MTEITEDAAPRAGVRNRRLIWAGLLVGLALIIGLVAWQGIGDVLALLTSAGWALLLVSLAAPLPLFCLGWSWRLLYSGGGRPWLGRFVLGAWVGQSVNTLLPVATIGGELVKARLLVFQGADGARAMASVVADKAAQAVSMVMMMALGALLMVLLGADWRLTAGAASITVLGGVAVWLFVLIQRRGIFGPLVRPFARLMGGRVDGMQDRARNLDEFVREIHRQPGRFLLASTGRLVAVVLLSAEVWIAAQLMGIPITIPEAILLRVVSHAVRAALFFVWGGIGVQEGVFVLLGGVVGGTAEVMLAMSLATRIRELVIGLPGLLAWQLLEVQRLASKR